MTDEAMQEELDRFARQLASWDEVKDGGVADDDYVEAVVSLAGQGEDENAWTQKLGFYPRDERVGPFTVKDVKAALTDAKAGDTVEMDGELPEEEDIDHEALAELAGEPVKLDVAINSVYRQQVPEIDDEFAKKLNLGSADEVRDLVKERLENRLQTEKRDATRFAVIEAVLQTIPMDLPPSVIERATVDEQRKLMIRALRSGMSRDKAEEVTRENADNTRDMAVRNLKASLLLRQIADDERIYVIDSEVQEQVQALASRQGWSQRRTERYMEENDLMQSLRWDLREEKATQFIVDNAKVEEIDPEEFQRRMREARGEGEESAETDDK